MVARMNVTLFLLIMVVWLLIACVPAYVVGVRCEVRRPELAFIPIAGPWIVIFQSIGVSAWLTCIAVLPYVGLLVGLWAAWAVPDRHERSWLWSLWFIVPGLNLIGFWVYAFTLTPATEPIVAASHQTVPPLKRDRLVDDDRTERGQIRRLASLRDEGILTEDEFQAKKAALIDKLHSIGD